MGFNSYSVLSFVLFNHFLCFLPIFSLLLQEKKKLGFLFYGFWAGNLDHIQLALILPVTIHVSLNKMFKCTPINFKNKYPMNSDWLIQLSFSATAIICSSVLHSLDQLLLVLFLIPCFCIPYDFEILTSWFFPSFCSVNSAYCSHYAFLAFYIIGLSSKFSPQQFLLITSSCLILSHRALPHSTDF